MSAVQKASDLLEVRTPCFPVPLLKLTGLYAPAMTAQTGNHLL